MKASSSAARLKGMIDKAIEDHQITVTEYERILHMASQDHHVDPEEKALLRSLQEMIENGTLRRVPDRA